ncbi:hypothetical protein SAMN06272781_8106 [Streptomyces sp. 1222.2]|nr:hypothetical protein SAMN06272781_8106 [Streptomyces sp. 1222.2]
MRRGGRGVEQVTGQPPYAGGVLHQVGIASGRVMVVPPGLKAREAEAEAEAEAESCGVRERRLYTNKAV